MKVRLLDPGFKNFTGQFGFVDFVDGVSDDISRAEAERLGCILPVEEVGTGRNPAITQSMVERHNQNLEEMGVARTVGRTVAAISEQPTAPKPAAAKVENTAEPVKVPVELKYDYTEEDLDALIKKEGIAGLRAFTEAYGVNGKSIPSIVKKMMELKAEKNPVKQVEPEPVVVVEPVAEVVEPVVEAPAETVTEVVEDDDVVVVE